MSTIERAYALARTGKYASVAKLQAQLKLDGCRAVEALLSPRAIRSHLEAICAASATAPREIETRAEQDNSSDDSADDDNTREKLASVR